MPYQTTTSYVAYIATEDPDEVVSRETAQRVCDQIGWTLVDRFPDSTNEFLVVLPTDTEQTLLANGWFGIETGDAEIVIDLGSGDNL